MAIFLLVRRLFGVGMCHVRMLNLPSWVRRDQDLKYRSFPTFISVLHLSKDQSGQQA
jgi:hypothetical protein